MPALHEQVSESNQNPKPSADPPMSGPPRSGHCRPRSDHNARLICRRPPTTPPNAKPRQLVRRDCVNPGNRLHRRTAGSSVRNSSGHSRHLRPANGCPGLFVSASGRGSKETAIQRRTRGLWRRNV